MAIPFVVMLFFIDTSQDLNIVNYSSYYDITLITITLYHERFFWRGIRKKM